MLNVYEETPESVVALLDDLEHRGLKVRAVELGNEPYWDGRSLADVRAYIDFCRPLAAAIKRHRPDVKVGACFAPFGNPANYEEIWNAPLAQEDWFDAVVFHDYFGGQGIALEEGRELPADALPRPEAMFDAVATTFAELTPGKPVWFTEWNVGLQGLDRWKNTGAELQFIAAGFVRLAHHRGTITRAAFHDFYDSRFGAFYFDPDAGRIERNASWELFRLLGTAFAGSDRFRPVEFPAGPGADGLVGFATEGADGVRLFVLNRGAAAREVALPAEFRGELLRATIACPLAGKLPLSTPLVESFPVAGGRVTLPPESVSLVGPRATLEFRPKPDDAANLFPRRPHLTLWYPPYADVQPRFDLAGVYAIETERFRDKPLAVLKLDTSALGLAPGGRYRLDFEAEAEPEGGVVVKLPDAGQADAAYVPLQRRFGPQRFTFRYDPQANGDEVAIVFTQETIAATRRIAFRDFRIGPAD